jgi:beta-hydroxylase
MGLAVLVLFIVCGIYIQHRGVVQHEKFSRKLTDHSNIFGPINCLFYSFSKVPNSPYLNVEDFPQLQILQDNWQLIRDEAVALNEQAQIKSSDKLDDIGFNSFFRTGWKRFYLKWYGSSLNSARKLCPQTVALLESIPTVKGAMFAMLPPGARLVRHRDPYAGSMRYHLGLVTPNSDDCFINVDGQHYSWRDGEAVMFDETFIHYAENCSEQNRIILFIDVKRPVSFFLVDWINRLFSRVVLGASATKNIDGDKIGFLNRIFSSIYKIRILGKKIKAYNRKLYYTLQYGLYAWLIYLIFF